MKLTMKSFKLELLLTTIFFILFSTSQLWEGRLGFLAIFSTILLFVAFVSLLIRFLYLLIMLIKEKFKSKYRLALVLIMGFVIGFAVYEPQGLIGYESLFGKKLFFASTEGAANCTVNLNLHESGRFHYQEICFGLSSTVGKYKINNDTVFFFKSDNFYQYGVFDPKTCLMDFSNSQRGSLKLYKYYEDSLPKSDLCIIKNEVFMK